MTRPLPIGELQQVVAVGLLSLVVAGCSDGVDETRPPKPAAPCAMSPMPIGRSQALDALRRHGFSVRGKEGLCKERVAAVITNADVNGVLESEGIVDCFLYERAQPGATNRVVRRGVDGGDAQLTLANFVCAILADSPDAEEKIDPLEAAFDDLQHAIRP